MNVAIGILYSQWGNDEGEMVIRERWVGGRDRYEGEMSVKEG